MATKAQKKLTVFLSHSHGDIDKVRKVRDVLETLNCEPITFFLACMDDSNPLLEKLIMDEIDARNVFVYCRSKKAEKSKWVQKELEYIRSSGQKRVYEINLEESFEASIANLMSQLMQLIYSNTVVLCRAKSANAVTAPLKLLLEERGFVTLEFDPTRVSGTQTRKQTALFMTPGMDDSGKSPLEEKVEHYCGSGIFVPILYRTQMEYDPDCRRVEDAFHLAKQNKKARVLQVCVDACRTERDSQSSLEGCYLPEAKLTEGVYQIVEMIEKLSRKSQSKRSQ